MLKKKGAIKKKEAKNNARLRAKCLAIPKFKNGKKSDIIANNISISYSIIGQQDNAVKTSGKSENPAQSKQTQRFVFNYWSAR